MLKAANTPRSVPAYSVCAGRVNVRGREAGSMMMVFTGVCGRLERIDVHAVPLLTVRYKRLPATYAVDVTTGSRTSGGEGARNSPMAITVRDVKCNPPSVEL